MKITSLIAQHLLDVHEGNNWTEVNIADTLSDVTKAEAITLTKASPNTIAALLHHLTFWNRLMIQRMNGIDVKNEDNNGYNVPPLQTEEDWLREKADNNMSSHELAFAIENFDENKLFVPLINGTTAYKNLQGTVEHVHYHLGQILIIKKLVKATKQAT